MIRTIIIGCGARGFETYGRYAKRAGSGMQIVALCDNKGDKLEIARKELNIDKSDCYLDADELLSRGKIGDLAIISTYDREHFNYAMKAIELGYNLLLEKPISNTLSECIAIREQAKKYNVKVIVCHVMRYTSYYRYVKGLLKDGTIGKLMGIEQTEDVAYWHMAHAFVRGNFCNSETTTPMILQKCCHDMDLLIYLTEQKPKKINSRGELTYFKSENAPLGSAQKCVDCTVTDCPFNAEKFYLGMYRDKVDNGLPTNVWPLSQVAVNPSEESLELSVRTTKWGDCVFHSANNVVDHQFTMVEFEDGLVGTLTMIGFSNDGGRQTHLYGTKGEIYLDEQRRNIEVSLFGQRKKTVDFDSLSDDFSGHGGGDAVMMKELVEALENNVNTINTSIDYSVDSHIMAFGAEYSRLNDGITVDCQKFEKVRE